jgi:hypothetical protein
VHVSLIKLECSVSQTGLSGFSSSNSVVSVVKLQNRLFTPPPLGDIKGLSGSSLALAYVYSWCGLHCGRQNNILYSWFGRNNPNHTYHCSNSSPYHPSHYRCASSSISPFTSFAWPRPIHSPAPHTPANATGQAKAQIWPPMSSPQQLASSTMTCSYFTRVARVTYNKQLLHGSKEDESTSVSCMYNSPYCQSPLGVCVLLIPHHWHLFD